MALFGHVSLWFQYLVHWLFLIEFYFDCLAGVWKISQLAVQMQAL